MVHLGARIDRGRAEMREQDHIVHLQQLLRHLWLMDEDVEAGSVDFLVLQRLINAGSSTTEPRAMLMRMPFGPSASSTCALIILRVSAPPGTITMRVSTSFAMATRSG